MLFSSLLQKSFTFTFFGMSYDYQLPIKAFFQNQSYQKDIFGNDSKMIKIILILKTKLMLMVRNYV